MCVRAATLTQASIVILYHDARVVTVQLTEYSPKYFLAYYVTIVTDVAGSNLPLKAYLD
jgi:hypothetical protein